MVKPTKFKKKAVRRLTPAQAKAAAKAMKPNGKMPIPKMSTKFTPPGYDPEDMIDHGVDEAKEKS